MPIFIRPATSADVPTLSEFNSRMAQETEGKTLDPETLALGARAVLLDPSRGRYFLAEQDGAVAGQLMITPEWSDWRNAWFWWIQSVYVRPESRRQGVFRALYEFVEAEALRQGVCGLRLYVEKDNVTAQQTYKNLGMTEVGYLLLQRWPL